MPFDGTLFTKQELDDDEELLRLLALIAAAEASIRRTLTTAIVAARQQNTLEELADLIEAGNFQDAIDAAARTGAIQLADEVQAVFVGAGRDTARVLSGSLEVVVGFDQTNFRAVARMRENRLRLIREFTEGQRSATREALVDGVTLGLNPRDQARAFRDSIGLTARQERAIQNYRRLLERGSAEALNRQLRDRRFDPTVRAAVSGDRQLTATQIDRMVTRYRERFLKFRSETIARTEALRAAHEGADEAFQQAIDSGDLDPSRLVNTWVTARDERVRGSHSFMNGQRQPTGQPFRSGLGNFLRFPGDPNAPASDTVQCRCVVTRRFVLPQT